MIETSIITYCIIIAITGVVLAMFASLIPGLHIYSILGFVVLFIVEGDSNLEPLLFSTLTVSMLIGYCLGSNISAVYFQTPDDSSVFLVFPSQKYVDTKRGFEAIYLSGLGAVIGVIASCLMIFFFSDFLVKLVDLLIDHTLWIIATAMVFVWMSEWPKDPARQESKWGKLGAAWLQLGMGLVVIIASGILGIYMYFSQLVPPERSYQGLAAAFVGLFAFPSLIQNLFSSKKVPKQHVPKSVECEKSDILQGLSSGIIGGGIGMLIPSLTAGVGNSFARHAVAQSGDRSFMIGQGVSRSVYYVGAVLLLFIPGVTIRRGGASLFITLFYVPNTTGELFLIAAAAIIAAGFGWLVFQMMNKGITKIAHKLNSRYIALVGIVVMLSLNYYMLGISGLIITVVATAIGYLPIVFNTRRVYCIAVITIPMMLSMAGLGFAAASFFGIA